MNNIERQFGLLQSPYDKRDYKFKDLAEEALGVATIPDSYETLGAPFVYDQGTTQMCGAFSSCMLRYLQERDQNQSELNEPFSPGYVYANRLPGEDFEGMYLRSIAKKWQDDGCVLHSDFDAVGSYQYCKASFEPFKDSLRERAHNFRISSYYTCNSRREVQLAIMESKAVLTGVPVYRNFFNAMHQDTVEFVKGQPSLGGHAVLLRGWKTTQDGKLYWLLQNSWGKDWGDKGHCWLSEEYPWMDSAFVFIDNVIELNIKQYKERYKNES